MRRALAFFLCFLVMLGSAAQADGFYLDVSHGQSTIIMATATPEPTATPVPATPDPEAPVTAAPTAAATATPAPSKEAEILLSLAGDCTLAADEKYHSMPESFIGVLAANGNDYRYPLALAQPWFAADDFTLVNLECVLTDYASLRNTALYLNFRGPASYVNILTQGSVEGVSMSNNHALDYGPEGLRDCQANLTAAGVKWAYNNNYFTFERQGVKFAVFSFRRYYMEAYYQWLEEQIPRVKSEEGVDFVIVCLHHGEEYEVKHNDYDQTRFARHAIDHGADLVVGTHPHVLQGIEVYKNRLILYSLGNFSFGGNNRPYESSIPTAVMQVRLNFTDQQLDSTQLTIFPFHATGTTPYSNYQPTPVYGAEAAAVMAILQNDTPFPLKPYIEGQGAVQDIIYAK